MPVKRTELKPDDLYSLDSFDRIEVEFTNMDSVECFYLGFDEAGRSRFLNVARENKTGHGLDGDCFDFDDIERIWLLESPENGLLEHARLATISRPLVVWSDSRGLNYVFDESRVADESA